MQVRASPFVVTTEVGANRDRLAEASCHPGNTPSEQTGHRAGRKAVHCASNQLADTPFARKDN